MSNKGNLTKSTVRRKKTESGSKPSLLAKLHTTARSLSTDITHELRMELTEKTKKNLCAIFGPDNNRVLPL